MGYGFAPISRTASQWLRGDETGVVVGRVFSQEFKDQIVALHQRDGRTFAEIATEFGLSPTSAATWRGGGQGQQTTARAHRGVGCRSLKNEDICPGPPMKTPSRGPAHASWTTWWDDNHPRPHSALNYRSPLDYATLNT